ncbi:hypothetical protein CR517_00890 [Escherichia coli]|nr:hypothetical protein CR517_00890 [Escherichia coli]
MNVKTKPSLATRISPAIIINFIYYRHSFLNVCLPLFQPMPRIRFFLPFFTHFSLFCATTEKL